MFWLAYQTGCELLLDQIIICRHRFVPLIGLRIENNLISPFFSNFNQEKSKTLISQLTLPNHNKYVSKNMPQYSPNILLPCLQSPCALISTFSYSRLGQVTVIRGLGCRDLEPAAGIRRLGKICFTGILLEIIVLKIFIQFTICMFKVLTVRSIFQQHRNTFKIQFHCG